jgi:pimeloyl-ACP methyl ester carboxylesterase
MSDIQISDGSTPILIHTEHGPLHGQLILPPNARALIILAHAGANPESHDEALGAILRHNAFATLRLDLLPYAEERFDDVHNNVSLLAKRLLGALNMIKREMQNEAMPTLPIGLCAADHASPVIVRVAAQRDHDIAAVVCRGGLIDLAGMLYLRSLESPLLVLVGEKDATLISSSQRALKEVSCSKALQIIQDTESTFAAKSAFDDVAHKIVHWFDEHGRLSVAEKPA